MAPKKRVLAVVKIQLPAGAATPAPPVGPPSGPTASRPWSSASSTTRPPRTSGARWCRSRSPSTRTARFTFVLKTPPTPVLIRQAAGLERVSATAGPEQAGTITDAQVAEIAKVKLPDLNTDDLEAAKLQVAGTARSMGIAVAG